MISLDVRYYCPWCKLAISSSIQHPLEGVTVEKSQRQILRRDVVCAHCERPIKLVLHVRVDRDTSVKPERS